MACSFIGIHVTKCTCRCLIQGMSQNVQNILEWRCLIHGLQQNVTTLYSGIHQSISPNTMLKLSRSLYVHLEKSIQV